MTPRLPQPMKPTPILSFAPRTFWREINREDAPNTAAVFEEEVVVPEQHFHFFVRLHGQLYVRRADVAPAVEIHKAEVLMGQREQMIKPFAGSAACTARGVVEVGPERRLPSPLFHLATNAGRGERAPVVGAAGVFAVLQATFELPKPGIL